MRPKARFVADELELYEGELTADFQRVYALRLIDAVIERDPQELLDLIRWLPPDSAFLAAKQSNSSTQAQQLFQWSTQQDLLLKQVNLTQELIWVLAQVNSKKKIARPEPISGPHGSPETKKVSGGDANAFARMLLAQAKKG